jgi:hypothetical protein
MLIAFGVVGVMYSIFVKVWPYFHYTLYNLMIKKKLVMLFYTILTISLS